MTRIGAGVSTFTNAADAAHAACRSAGAALDEQPADLALLFLTPEHLDDVADAVAVVQGALEPRHVLGCVAQGVIGGARELENGPGVAVWAASLPGARIVPFHLEAELGANDIQVGGIPEVEGASLVTMFVEPYSYPVDALLTALDECYPGIGVVGGVALGAGPGRQALIVDRDVYTEGAIGAVLADVPVRAVVSQGCAAVGREAVVTNADRNVMLELAGEPALARLQREVESFTDRERELATRGGILAGIVIDENKPEYGRGDYLMRPIVAADQAQGSLAIGDHVRVGQTVRFHVRDGSTAHADLQAALDETLGGEKAAGALLFSCNGRGSNMFDEPDHDARTVAEAIDPHAIAGFFCGGEIGPVGGRSFLHGFTATLAVFLDA